MDIHPKEIGIWWPPAKAPEPLVERVRTNGFKGTPIVPVYRLPDGLNIHHYFVLADGHKRLDAAKKNKLFLPCAVYNPKEIIDPIALLVVIAGSLLEAGLAVKPPLKVEAVDVVAPLPVTSAKSSKVTKSPAPLMY